MPRRPKPPPDFDDNPEWTKEDFARAVRFDPPVRLSEIGAEEFLRLVRRGRQKSPTKVSVSIRFSRDVLDHFKRSGRGWQTRIDDALREFVNAELKASRAKSVSKAPRPKAKAG